MGTRRNVAQSCWQSFRNILFPKLSGKYLLRISRTKLRSGTNTFIIPPGGCVKELGKQILNNSDELRKAVIPRNAFYCHPVVCTSPGIVAWDFEIAKPEDVFFGLEKIEIFVDKKGKVKEEAVSVLEKTKLSDTKAKGSFNFAEVRNKANERLMTKRNNFKKSQDNSRNGTKFYSQ